MKLKHKDIVIVKEALLIKQNYICPICHRDLRLALSKDRCLDHDHKDGRVRAVLHRACNIMEGKTYRSFIRTGLRNQGVDYQDFLESLSEYFNYPKTDMLHPSYKEKKVKVKKVFDMDIKVNRNLKPGDWRLEY